MILIILVTVGIILSFLCIQNKLVIFHNLEKLHDAKKIVVIGCSGSGKTYLTFKLQEKLHLPVYHLDQYAWKPNWEKIDFEDFKKIHHDLCKKNTWIIEGTYLKLLRERVENADVVVFLDMPGYVCVSSVIKRAIFNAGEVIPGNPENCKQNMLSFKFIAFLQWIWNFNNKHRPAIMETLNEFKEIKQVYILKSFAEVNDFIDRL